MKKITLVDYFVELLKPYTHMPEFTTCVMKALEKLGHRVNTKSMYVEEAGTISEEVYSELSTKGCRISGKEANAIIIDECDT